MQQTMGKALLIVAMDPPPELEDEVNRWYDEEHLADELRRVPGVVSARRFAAATAVHREVFAALPQPPFFPKFLAIFELETEDVLRSKEYLEFVANPTEWTRRVIGDVPVIPLVYSQVFPEEGAFTRQ